MKLLRLSIVLVLIHPLAAMAQEAPDQAKPDQAKPDQAKPDQAKPDQAKPDQVKPDQAKPDQVKPDQAKPDQVKTDESAKEPGSQLQNVFRLLEEEADVKSVVATKVAQRTVESPAVVEVITANQIQAAGYQSVAEALAHVPGLAVNTDYVSDNVGVRGISGGLRSGASQLKVLLDGQPIAFRPDGQNFLGPELIPMSAIDRIEVLRGPASALYGLNAFLGVVNIVTKKGGVGEYSISALGDRGQRFPHFGGSAEAFGMDKIGGVGFTLAAHAGYDNRSGLKLPANSPDYTAYNPNAKSQSDISQPLSLFGAVYYKDFTLTSNYEQKDAVGEFIDYGAFSHSTRIDLDNWFVRVGHNIKLDHLQVTSYAAYANGGPLAHDLIQPVIDGQLLSYHVKRNFGFSAVDLGTQATIEVLESSILLVGAEGTYDRESIRTDTFISNVTDAQAAGGEPKVVPFENAAGYAQGLFRELGWLQLSGNLRYDYNNQYGSNINYRGGIVLAPAEQLHIKLLTGSSYRAPTPEQLYGTPVAPGDVIGSLAASDPQSLKPQTARIQEAAINYDLVEQDTTLHTQVTGYYTQIYDRIEYLLDAAQYRPTNTAQSTTYGGEFSLSVLQNVADFMSVSLSGSVSYANTTIDLPVGTLTDRELERLKINELYPTWMYKSQLMLQVPSWYLRIYAQVNAYSQRLQSQSNQTFDRPFVGLPLYTIPASYPVDIAVSTVGLKLFPYETFIQLSIKDVFDTESVQPGFGGINLPPLGRRFFLQLKQEF